MRRGCELRRDCEKLVYPQCAVVPAASMMTFCPPLPMLSEARVLPVAAADKLTLDS